MISVYCVLQISTAVSLPTSEPQPVPVCKHQHSPGAPSSQSRLLAALLTELTSQLQLQLAAVSGSCSYMPPPIDSNMNLTGGQFLHIAPLRKSIALCDQQN